MNQSIICNLEVCKVNTQQGMFVMGYLRIDKDIKSGLPDPISMTTGKARNMYKSW